MNKRALGTHFEEAAIAYLENEGIVILDKNVRCGHIGEIDLIGVEPVSGDGKDETLIFFEVKYRKSERYGSAVYAVDDKKRHKIRRCAEYYLAYRPTDRYIRFDVIAIDGETVTWYKDAF